MGTCSRGALDVEVGSEGVLPEGWALELVPVLAPVCVGVDEVWLALSDRAEDEVELELPHPVTANPSTSIPLTVKFVSRPMSLPS